MRYQLILIGCVILSGCGPEPRETPVSEIEDGNPSFSEPGQFDLTTEMEGVYCTPFEFSGFTGITLELNQFGGFRYWYYTDVIIKDDPSYPFKGTYTIQNGRVTLYFGGAFQSEWYIERQQDISLLLNATAHQKWVEENVLRGGFILVKTIGKPDARGNISRPLIRPLLDAENKSQP